jgi:hypothetical protein
VLVIAFCMGGAPLAGCTGTEVGNPVEELRVSLLARSSSPEVVLGSTSDAGPGATTDRLAIDELWISLGDARFVVDSDCNGNSGTRVLLGDPLIADLADGPKALAERLPEGRYCSARVSLERAVGAQDAGAVADAGAPDALAGHSVLLRGHRADGVPFSIRSRDKPDFVLRSRGAVIDLEGAQTSLLLAFDVAAWLDRVDLAGAVPNADDAIVIEPGQEDARLRTFETNLRTSLRLFADGDADGMLSADEAGDPLAQ